jgi:hypothetical protein
MRGRPSQERLVTPTGGRACGKIRRNNDTTVGDLLQDCRASSYGGAAEVVAAMREVGIDLAAVRTTKLTVKESARSARKSAGALPL